MVGDEVTVEQVAALLRLPFKPHVRAWLGGVWLGLKIGKQPFPKEAQGIKRIYKHFIEKEKAA